MEKYWTDEIYEAIPKTLPRDIAVWIAEFSLTCLYPHQNATLIEKECNGLWTVVKNQHPVLNINLYLVYETRRFFLNTTKVWLIAETFQFLLVEETPNFRSSMYLCKKSHQYKEVYSEQQLISRANTLLADPSSSMDLYGHWRFNGHPKKMT